MTISRYMTGKVSIKTLFHLSTRKRSVMILANPDRMLREDWTKEFNINGISFVYLTLGTV